MGDKSPFCSLSELVCSQQLSIPPPALLFPHEFGWIDGKRSPGWNGGRCDTDQRKRQYRSTHDYEISWIRPDTQAAPAGGFRR
ncbi:MAG TPA: hypothetical protein VK638_28020 [Edaphobacter sp.]|nr:hypothetical protein [Edaphobacter sp.]